jgi:hypothetical protein
MAYSPATVLFNNFLSTVSACGATFSISLSIEIYEMKSGICGDDRRPGQILFCFSTAVFFQHLVSKLMWDVLFNLRISNLKDLARIIVNEGVKLEMI